MKRHFLSLAVLALCAYPANAQWVATGGPAGSNIFAVAEISPGVLLAGSSYGIYRTADKGKNWVPVNSGLQPITAVYCFAVTASRIFAGAYNGVYMSADNGLNWAPVNTGLPVNPNVKAIISCNGAIFAGGNDGVFRSTDNGSSWTAVNAGLPANPLVTAMACAKSGVIFVGTNGKGFFKSTNNGTTWTDFSSNLSPITVTYAIVIVDTMIYLGTPTNAVWYNTTSGAYSWWTMNGGMPSNNIYSLTWRNDTLFAGTIGGVLRTYKNTARNEIWWTPFSSGLPTTSSINFLAVCSTGEIVAGTSAGIYLFSDSLYYWRPINSGLPRNSNIYSLCTSGAALVFAGTDSCTIWRSGDNGTTWKKTYDSMPGPIVRCLAMNGAKLFAGTDRGMFRSADSGTTWIAADSGLPQSYTGIYSLIVRNGSLLAGTQEGLYQSSDDGETWDSLNTGLPQATVVSIVPDNNNLFVATSGPGVYFSTNNGSTWTTYNFGLVYSNYLKALAATSGYLLASAGSYGVYRTSAAGRPVWTRSDTGMPIGASVNVFAERNGNIFAGSNANGIFLTANSGVRWAHVDSNLSQFSGFRCLAMNNTYIYAGVINSGVWRRALSEMIVPTKNEDPGSPIVVQKYSASGLTVLSRTNKGVLVDLVVSKSAQCRATIYTLSGKAIMRVMDTYVQAGSHRLTWNTRAIPSGCYVIRLQAGSSTSVERLPLCR
jgi:photosystem II stability/assembly factor-like uncharacterized protein